MAYKFHGKLEVSQRVYLTSNVNENNGTAALKPASTSMNVNDRTAALENGFKKLNALSLGSLLSCRQVRGSSGNGHSQTPLLHSICARQLIGTQAGTRRKPSLTRYDTRDRAPSPAHPVHKICLEHAPPVQLAHPIGHAIVRSRYALISVPLRTAYTTRLHSKWAYSLAQCANPYRRTLYGSVQWTSPTTTLLRLRQIMALIILEGKKACGIPGGLELCHACPPSLQAKNTVNHNNLEKTDPTEVV